MAASAQGTPRADALPDEYANCTAVRRAGEPLASASVPPPNTTVWPALCGDVSGWAGIGTYLHAFAHAFSRDSRRFVTCGASPPGCQVIDLRTANVVARATPDWGDDGPGSMAVEGAPRIARLWRRNHAADPTEVGAFPYVGSVLVSWSVDPGGRVLHVSLIDVATGAEREVARFPAGSHESSQPIVPMRVWFSGDGSVMAVRVMTGQGGSGSEVALVNVHREVAALFRRVAANGEGERSASYLAHAAVAERRGSTVARALPHLR